MGFTQGAFSGGNYLNGIVLPVSENFATISPAGAFTVNADGTVTVNQSGAYLVTGRIGTGSHASADAFAVQINGNGTPGTYYDSATIMATACITSVTTILTLTAGDTISNALVSSGPVALSTFTISGTQTASSALTIVKIG
jgi:hypothetical protein